MNCDYVSNFLDTFGKQGGSANIDQVGEHVNACPSCHERLSNFFRVMEAPNSEYLEQSLDDLTESIYNLAKALIKRPSEDDDHENVRFVNDPDTPETYIDQGNDVIDDVQDYTGSDSVRGSSMEGLRDLIEDSSGAFDLPHELLQQAIDLKGSHALDCHNLRGILYLQEEKPALARVEFQSVLDHTPVDTYVRSVQVHSLANLAYVQIAEGNLSEAIRLAHRARVLAEECGLDSFTAVFAENYARLLRSEPADIAAVRESLSSLRSDPTASNTLDAALAMENNAEIQTLYVSHDLL